MPFSHYICRFRGGCLADGSYMMLAPSAQQDRRRREDVMRAAAAAAPAARALFIPSGSLDPLASSSLRCIANCGYFGSRRASDGALGTTQPHSYHWACNETMDFFIRVLTLTACLPCIHCLLRCSVRSVGNGRKRRAMASCHILKKYPFRNGSLTNYSCACQAHVREVLWI